MGTEDIDNTLVEVLQGQLEDMNTELNRQKSINEDLEGRLHTKRCEVLELEQTIGAMQRDIGQDIAGFYDKAKSVIESQFGLGIKMRPADLIKLWLKFYRLAIQFTGELASASTIYRFEQAAQGMAHQMVQSGELMLEADQLGSMLERIIYPYITIETGDGTFTWTELREKYQ